MEENLQHVQLPNDMAKEGLSPKDQLVYVCIKRYENKDTHTAFPSLQVLHEKSSMSINSIRTSIQKLVDTKYITLSKKGRMNVYHFNPYKTFEPFSYDFLDNTDLTSSEKAYILVTQQYMFKDIKDLGKLSLSNKELSKLTNMSEDTIYRCNKSLEHKNYLVTLKNASKNLETGCKTDTKVFQLAKLGQAIVWKLKEHDDLINQNSKDIQDLQEKVAQQDKLITKLLNKLEEVSPSKEYIM